MRNLAFACSVLVACGGDATTGPAASSSVVAASTSTSTASAGPTEAPGADGGLASTTGSGASATATASASASAKPIDVVQVLSAQAVSAAPTSSASSGATPTAAPTATVTVVPGSAGAVASDIDALYVPLARYKAKFIQKYRQKITGTDKESRGTVFVERPGKISFRYDPPNKNRIVSDGKTLKIYVEGDQQMFEHPVEKTEYPGALAFVMGKGILPSFNFTFNEKATFDKGPVLVGTPRQSTPNYESVLFYVDKTKLAAKNLGAVTAVLIVDAQGNRNRFEFFDAEEPKTIDPGEFTFTPPAGTNVTK